MKKSSNKEITTENHKKVNLKKLLIPGSIILVAVGVVGSVVIGNVVRTNKINNQALANLNEQDMSTTVFCSGESVKLSSNVYNTIKENGYDLVIYNKEYIAKIPNESVTEKIDLNIFTTEYAGFKNSEAFRVDTNNADLKELEVKSKINKDYLSEYILNDTQDFIRNDALVENGYAKVTLKDNEDKYIMSYVIPESINVEDVEVLKGAGKQIELGIDKKDYTLGSVIATCNDEEAITIDSEYKIVGNKVGEYTLTYSTDKYSKEAKLKVLPSVETINLSKLTLELVEGASEKIDATFTPEDAVNKELTWTSSDESIATVDGEGNVKAVKPGNCEIKVVTTQEPKVEAVVMVEIKEKPTLAAVLTAPAQVGVTGITYINGIMLVNKTHPIPADYNPGLDSQTYQAYLRLKADAEALGYSMPLLSGFRSYETQRGLYNRYCAEYGQAAADTFSARPGTSEHQTGLAMDVGMIEDWYGDTAAGQWLAANCHKYGFIIRYPQGKEHITGYKYEPWHIRYLGVDVATDVYNSGLTLEEYLGAI